MHALAQQGFVNQERRGKRTYFKLRFRRAGRQIVRYLGDEMRAAAVATELAAHQSDTRILQQLRLLTKAANRLLRDGKKRLQPILAANGLAFHGLAIRHPRQT